MFVAALLTSIFLKILVNCPKIREPWLQVQSWIQKSQRQVTFFSKMGTQTWLYKHTQVQNQVISTVRNSTLRMRSALYLIKTITQKGGYTF